MNKVVVTGINACCSLGNNISEVWSKLAAGESGIRQIERIEVDNLHTRIGGQIQDDYLKTLDETHTETVSKNAELSLLCAQGLFQQQDIQDLHCQYSDIGLILGSGLGGLYFSEESLKRIYNTPIKHLHPLTVPFVDPNGVISAVSRRWNITGHQFTISTACSSGANAIGTAMDLIRSGRLDCVITGGVEYTFSPLIYSGFDQLRAMSRDNTNPKESCKPFSTNRDGFVMGEGAAMLILESEVTAIKRGATIIAEVAGYGVTGGAHHIVKPVDDGSDGFRAMQLALQDAELKPEHIDLINPHATGTVLNDQAEYRSLKRLFGECLPNIPVVPTKQLTGHLLGAAGALEAVHTIKCLEQQTVTPIRYYESESGSKLNISTTHSYQAKIEAALSNSFGFGNNNASLIFKRYT